MTAVRGKPSGWGVHDKLTSVIMEIIDEQIPFLVDGRGGSGVAPYNPSTVIEITGTHGLKCSSPFQCTGTSTFTGSINCNAQTTTWNGGTCALVASAMTLDATSSITMAAGSAFTCAGSVTVTGTTNLNGTTTFNANAGIASGCTLLALSGATLELASGANLSLISGSTATLAAGSTVAQGGIISNTGAGHTTERVVVISTDANQAVGIATADVIICPVGVLSADRTLTIPDDPVGGSRIRIINKDPSSGLNVKNSVSANISPTFLKTLSGYYEWIDIVCVGAGHNWQYIGGRLV